MSRRRRNPGIFDMAYDILELVFKVLPPWTCIPAALASYLAVVWYGTNKVSNPALHQLWHMFGGVMAVLCLMAGFKGWQFQRARRRFLEQEIDLQWVEKLTWREFETNVAAVYRKRGYCVEHLGGNGPDGGIDIVLVKGGRKTVVQCKHWRTSKVGVKPIRELYGVMTAEKADAAILIASGSYTPDAKEFAKGKPIELLGRDEFITLVREFQTALRGQKPPPRETSTPAQTAPPVTAPVSTPACPSCNSPMVLRTAKQSANAGKQFWGCSNFRYGCTGRRESKG